WSTGLDGNVLADESIGKFKGALTLIQEPESTSFLEIGKPAFGSTDPTFDPTSHKMIVSPPPRPATWLFGGTVQMAPAEGSVTLWRCVDGTAACVQILPLVFGSEYILDATASLDMDALARPSSTLFNKRIEA